jgi:hypothetical protein
MKKLTDEEVLILADKYLAKEINIPENGTYEYVLSRIFEIYKNNPKKLWHIQNKYITRYLELCLRKQQKYVNREHRRSLQKNVNRKYKHK